MEESTSPAIPAVSVDPRSFQVITETTAYHLTTAGVDVEGSSYNAIVGGTIAAVVLVLLCLVLILLRYMHQHKGTYRTNEAKGMEFAETADAALKTDPVLQESMDEAKQEYFI